MKNPFWTLEWRLAFRRRRLLALNMGIPLLLVLPVALGGAPPFHAAAVYTVLFVLFGTFGSAIPLIRDGDRGLLRRFLLSGASPRTLLLGRTLAGALVDSVQLLPALGVILLTAQSSQAVLFVAAPLVLVGAVLAANLVGVWVAAAARSLAEGALFAAVVSLFLLHGSGVFRTPAPGGLGAALEAWLPFGPLHRLLLAVVGGGGSLAGAFAGDVLTDFIVVLAGGVLLLLLTLLAAPPISERLSGGRR